jgi:hypothetical protein
MRDYSSIFFKLNDEEPDVGFKILRRGSSKFEKKKMFKGPEVDDLTSWKSVYIIFFF